ncbi:MAG: UDP-N-acetylmuramate-L-alanine ligase [Parcubacteria group bacterium GW2011_GWA2_49_9]|nr:MAG: UDP-N-acetylmuramate-L-alanine ligase [Parcubacteria group bacterium GW2011_GWA2_49_9]
MDFSKTKTVHFIGIGGIGTSAIARMFLLEGKRVSGSDMAESEVTEGLREAGATIFINESDAEKGRPLRQRAPLFEVPSDTELVIYTIAIPQEHAELVEAKKRGIPVISYPEALGVISKEKYTIAITGTHGKTTTTAMIAKILMDAGLDPTVIVGSFLLDVPPLLSKEGLGVVATPSQSPPWKGGEVRRTNFVAGKSKYLVVEGCEYCRSFLNLSPSVLVITNIDADHLDYYRDMEDIISAFVELSQKLPKDGYLILDSHAPNVEAVVKQSPCQNGDFAVLKLPEGFKLHIPGAHNLLNAKAALGVAKVLGIPDEKALASLSAFRGTWRRFEYRGKASNGALVYDDYGHHPTEIEATLQGTREMFPTQKIVVVFQPHLYSRTKQHLEGFASAFKEAGSVILLPIYPAREKDSGDINSQMVVDEIKKQGKDAQLVATFAEAASLAQTLCGAGDLIITLGAGETNRVADILVSS